VCHLIVESENPKYVVAYVYTPVQVEEKVRYLFVNAELARFGLARVHPIHGCRHKDLWQSLWDLQEQEAKPNKRGVWSKEAQR
jgi:endonuclease YncB( thermonuclease family)